MREARREERREVERERKEGKSVTISFELQAYYLWPGSQNSEGIKSWFRLSLFFLSFGLLPLEEGNSYWTVSSSVLQSLEITNVAKVKTHWSVPHNPICLTLISTRII